MQLPRVPGVYGFFAFEKTCNTIRRYVQLSCQELQQKSIIESNGRRQLQPDVFYHVGEVAILQTIKWYNTD